MIEVIKESQIKIGYSENPVGLYYPLMSLNRILGAELDEKGMHTLLNDFSGYSESTLGRIAVSAEGDRFCLRIPPEGVRYVHENVADSGFLTEFIGLIGSHSHDMTIEKILEVFGRYSDCVKCIPVRDDEFDYLVYFEDGNPDDYRYCIQLELGHAVYHRFTPEDLEDLGFGSL